MPVNILTQTGNSKLAAAGIMMFNIPATMQICGRVCKGCYAIREQKRYPMTLIAREGRYAASQDDDFAARIIHEIRYAKERPKYYRVHASGEFYSQEYIDKWVTIAKAFPDVTFYAYTKRKKDFDMDALAALENFILIDSLSHDGKLNYGPLDKAPAGAFICPEQKGAGIRCGIDCTYCMTKEAQESAPYFKKH